MKIQTKDLQGQALDWAVGVAHEDGGLLPVAYSTDWQFGGPIIEKMRGGIMFCLCDGVWHATNVEEWRAALNPKTASDTPCKPWSSGETQLIAAMRCYVASKLGDEVQVPGWVLP